MTLELTKLQEKVISQLGFDELDEDCKTTLQDIAHHGISGGFGGFIYYSETVDFFNDNKDLILEQLEEMAFALGEDTFTMVSKFNCLSGQELTALEVVEAIYNDTDDSTQVRNALAWFAAEEVAHQLEG